MMELPLALPAEAGLHVEAIAPEEHAISVALRTTAVAVVCPGCQQVCTWVQSRYFRHLLDLPCSGLAVHLRLQVRRFRCLHATCQRHIFTERLPLLAAPYARRTTRLGEVLRRVGFAVGGEGGA